MPKHLLRLFGLPQQAIAGPLVWGLNNYQYYFGGGGGGCCYKYGIIYPKTLFLLFRPLH